MTTVTPTEEHTMSSHSHTHFSPARQRVAAAAAGIILASASVACASAANQAPTSVARATAPSALRVGASTRAFAARVDELKSQGYVQIACTIRGALMFNPHTHRTEIVSASTARSASS
jgi:hypothetical protein